MGMFSDAKILLGPYYLVNFALSTSFLLCKVIPPVCSMVFAGDCEIEMRQTEIMFLLLMVVMIRARKTGSLTLVSYVTNSFMYCKVANTFLWFFAYKPYGLLYLSLTMVQGLLLPQPSYTGPQQVTYFRDIKGFKDETSKKNVTWLIEFYTAWNPSCVNFASIFAELSALYSLSNFKFGKVDLSRIPELGEEFFISDSSLSKQLPTLIMFKNGVAGMYRPVVDAKGQVIKFHFKKDNVITAFDLNNLHAECKKELEKKNAGKLTSGHAKTD